MPIQLLILRNVPEEEADEIRELLNSRAIDFYETPTDRWGVSMPAIWLNNEFQLDEARALLEKYHEQRFNQARSEYERLKHEGRLWTIFDEIRQNPLRFIAYLAIVAVILYFSTVPFIRLGQ